MAFLTRWMSTLGACPWGRGICFFWDFESQLIKPNRGDIFTVYWKVQKKAILWVVDNIKELAVSVWDLIVQSWFHVKIAIICLAIVIGIIVMVVLFVKLSKLGLVCRKLSKLPDSTEDRQALVPLMTK